MGHPRLSTRKCRLRPQIFFHGIIALFGPTHRPGFHRLAIQHSHTGVGIVSCAHAHLAMKRLPDVFPDPLALPSAELPVDGSPVGQVVRKQAPRTATAQDIQNGVDDLPTLVDGRSALGVDVRDQWLQNVPIPFPSDPRDTPAGPSSSASSFLILSWLGCASFSPSSSSFGTFSLPDTLSEPV